MPERPTVVVRCIWCQWNAQHTDDDVPQIMVFLIKQLTEHVRALHPEHIQHGQDMAMAGQFVPGGGARAH